MIRITNLVGKPATKAFAGNEATPDKPDTSKRRPPTAVDELREVARVELDGLAGPRQVTGGEDECGFIAVRPTQPLCFETKGGLVGARSHDVAVDLLEARRDEFRVHGVARGKFV